MRFIALMTFIGASNFAMAQSESWKIVVDAEGGWGQNFAMEVVSSGALVISVRRSTEAPRCMKLSDDDIAYVAQRIAQLKEYVGDDESKVPLRVSRSDLIVDALEAELRVYLYPASHVLTANAVLGPVDRYASGDGWRRYEAGGWRPESPPQILGEILGKAWEWQRQRADFGACVPASEAAQGA